MRLSVFAGLLVLVAANGTAAPAPPRFESSVESVYVDVFVENGGKAVTGLTSERFEVFDNGVLQKAHLVSASEVPLDALQLFDVSESLRGQPLEHLREAAQVFLRGLAPEDHVRLLSFCNALRLHQAVDRAPSSLGPALASLTAGGSTSLYDAIYAGLKLPTGSYRRLILIFSDGEDTSSWLSAEQLLAVAKESDALIYSVLMAPAGEATASSRALESLSKQTGGRALRVDSSGQVAAVFAAIVAELKNRYLLAYEPRADARPGWHELKVRLRNAKGTARARRGYYRSQP
jgi:Ca-activated chloride channel family protein